MAVHLLKMCVGVDSVDQLRQFQAHRLARGETLRHVTKNKPRRGDEVLAGGSLYWIIRRAIRVRQRIIGFEEVVTDVGMKCGLLLGNDLVATLPQPRRPHQGWRYLESDAAPDDLDKVADVGNELPPEMLSELRELGIM